MPENAEAYSADEKSFPGKGSAVCRKNGSCIGTKNLCIAWEGSPQGKRPTGTLTAPSGLFFVRFRSLWKATRRAAFEKGEQTRRTFSAV